MTKNLWPDFDFSNAALPKTPKGVILEAGDGLKERTNGLIEFDSLNTQITGASVELTFSLWSHRISYQYPFLKATFPIATLYPVAITVDKMDGPMIAANEEQLVKALEQAFRAETTIATIRQLVALSA